ncbi:MAG: flagellar FliJ family protein [Rhodospirillales bacterium]|nr:flagellar FliJ family protein [Rhodospirillales bacterium]
MAKNLKSVIRLHRYMVDEKRRTLGEILGEIQEYERQADSLEKEIISEQRVANAAPEEAGFGYGQYAAAAIERRHRLQRSTAETEQRIAIAQEEMREEFLDLKVFEIAQESRDQLEDDELQRQDQGVLDEIGQDRYRRRKSTK